jgi:hypothetical protein
MSEEQIGKIRELNDKLRRGGAAGKIMIVGGLAQAEVEEIKAVAEQVRDYDTFDEKNDPHTEHDFGSFKIGEQQYFWKIGERRERRFR